MSSDSAQMGDEITITLIRDGEYILHRGAVAEATENSEETNDEG